MSLFGPASGKREVGKGFLRSNKTPPPPPPPPPKLNKIKQVSIDFKKLTSLASTPKGGCSELPFLLSGASHASSRAATERWSKQRDGRRDATKTMKKKRTTATKPTATTATVLRLAIGFAFSREEGAAGADY